MNNEISSDEPAAADYEDLLAPGTTLADKDDTERLVRKVRVERLGDAAPEGEFDKALEVWVRELSKLLR